MHAQTRQLVHAGVGGTWTRNLGMAAVQQLVLSTCGARPRLYQGCAALDATRSWKRKSTDSSARALVTRLPSLTVFVPFWDDVGSYPTAVKRRFAVYVRHRSPFWKVGLSAQS